jgi:cysteine desulfurase
MLYFDNAATTKPDPRVVEKLNEYLTKFYGNPSSSHILGRISCDAIEDSRLQQALTLNCIPNEIVFTSGATESNNLAIKSCSNICSRGCDEQFHFIFSSIEHKSVSKIQHYLESLGHIVDLIECDSSGRINLDNFTDLIHDNTIMVSCIWVNNETGIIQPIEELSELCQIHDLILHTDATQAYGKLNLDFVKLPVSLASFSGHKFYGPKGVGGLYVNKDIQIECLIEGGSQESGKRAGTENVPGIAGMGKAAELLLEERQQDYNKMLELEDFFIEELQRRNINYEINGDLQYKVPCIFNINFGIDGTDLLDRLGDQVCLSKSSACSKDFIPSATLKAMGKTDEEIANSVRISFSKYTTKDEIGELLRKIKWIQK